MNAKAWVTSSKVVGGRVHRGRSIGEISNAKAIPANLYGRCDGGRSNLEAKICPIY